MMDGVSGCKRILFAGYSLVFWPLFHQRAPLVSRFTWMLMLIRHIVATVGTGTRHFPGLQERAPRWMHSDGT